MVKDVTEAVAGRPVYASFAFGLPVSLSKRGYTLDVARESSTPLPVDGDFSRKVALAKLMGHEGSVLEAKVWEEVLSTEAVSAVKTLQAAKASGIAVLSIDETNAATLIPRLSGYTAESVAEVADAVQAKKVVTIPERTVDYRQYLGVEGYIIYDGADGTGLYLCLPKTPSDAQQARKCGPVLGVAKPPSIATEGCGRPSRGIAASIVTFAEGGQDFGAAFERARGSSETVARADSRSGRAPLIAVV